MLTASSATAGRSITRKRLTGSSISRTPARACFVGSRPLLAQCWHPPALSDVENNESFVSHVPYGIARSLAPDSAIFNAAIRHLVSAPGGTSIHHHTAEAQAADRF